MAYRLLLVLGIALSATCPARGQQANRVTHGPMLGHVTSHGIRIWARTARPGSFRVQYGTSPKQLDGTADVKTSLDQDNTGVAQLTRLKPDTMYHYVTSVGDARGPGGSFRTLPDAAQTRDPKLNPRGLFNFKFEFACGNNQAPEHGNGPTLPTYDTLLRQVMDDVHFAILNGDWLYEDARDYPADKWRQQVGLAAKDKSPRLVRLDPSITGVWENYKLYLRRGKNLAKWHRHVPSYYTFDDHEILDDVFGTGTAGFRDRRAVFRDIGVQAWYHYLGWSNPVVYKHAIHFGRAKLSAGSDVLSDAEADFTKLKLSEMGNLHVHWGGQLAGVKRQDEKENKTGGDPNAGVYEIVEVLGKDRVRIRPAAKADGESSYSIGRRSYGKFRVGNCEFYLLDTRSHRDLHDKQNPAKPGVSMLGHHQTAWLIDAMKQSGADMHFVVSSVNFMIPHVGGGGVVKVDRTSKDDAWTVFLDEREKLIDFWDSLAKPVFVLTGDLHNSFAIRVTDNVWEFASGPHNSVNHRPSDEGNRPANGRFKYGPRECEIRWSTNALADIPRENRLFPHYCVVQVNNVFNNPKKLGGRRWVAFPHPHVIFQYYDGKTGKLRYAESVSTLIHK